MGTRYSPRATGVGVLDARACTSPPGAEPALRAERTMHLAVARTSCSTPDLSLPIRSSPAIIPGTRRCLTNLDLSPAWRLTGLEGDLPSLCKAEKFEVPRVRKSSPKQDL